VVAFFRVRANQPRALGGLHLVAGLDCDGGRVEVGVPEPDGFALVLVPDDDYPQPAGGLAYLLHFAGGEKVDWLVIVHVSLTVELHVDVQAGVPGGVGLAPRVGLGAVPGPVGVFVAAHRQDPGGGLLGDEFGVEVDAGQGQAIAVGAGGEDKFDGFGEVYGALTGDG